MNVSRLPVALVQAAGDCLAILRVFVRRPTVEDTPTLETGTPKLAVVMGAQVLASGRASVTLFARTMHAARMYPVGRISGIIVTGGLGQYPPDEARAMCDLLTGAGVPEEVITRESSARNTWESAVLVSRMLHERGVREITLVTDPLHCVRTVAAFSECGIVAVAEPVYESPSWRVRKMRVGQLVREMGASFWYRINHGVGSRTPR